MLYIYLYTYIYMFYLYRYIVRAETLSTIGAVCGSLLFMAGLFMYIYEMQHRKRFQARIYVD